MATPTTVYVKDAGADEWRIISGFTSWSNGIIPVTAPTYRNTGWTAGTAAVTAAGFYASVSGMPVGNSTGRVLGTVDTSTTPDSYVATVENITHANLPDEMAGTPPRQWLRKESVRVYAFNGETIPSAGQTFAVTSSASGVITLPTGSGLSTGDYIELTTGTIASVTANTLYIVQRLSATTYSLRDWSTGALIAAGAASSAVLTLITPATLMSGQFEFVFYSNTPVWSIGDPR